MRVDPGIALLLLTLTAFSVAAASHTWSGAGGNANWSTPANWSSGGAPTMGETNVALTFPASPASYVSNNDVTGLSVSGITVSDNGYGISGAPMTLTGNITFDAPAPSSSAFDVPVSLGASTSGGDYWVTVPAAGSSLNVGGTVSGFGTLTKAGLGKLSLSGANTYVGSTTISAGTLNIGSATALGATGTGTTVSSGAALTIQSGTAGIGVSEPLTLNGSGIGGTGALRALDGDNSWSGSITLNTADVTIASPLSAHLALFGTLQGPGGLTTAGGPSTSDLRITGSGSNTYAGPTTIGTS
ncbi:MAG TPA: autotransporter-associated beta strand repeat-containing protein, partial [Thermoanaerobaculia bacterium]|nr:autotransporter-associated beta strand repeat-containing protein [Thermoanaerobaculia bacterium]